MKPSKHTLSSCEFSAKEITVEFIIVKESCDGSSPVKSRQSFPVKRGELVWDRLKERTYRRLLRSTGIRLSPTVKADLIELVSRVAYSLPSHADHIFVCIITSEPSHYAKFNVVTGIHVDEDKEVSWDTVENPLLHVLQACKPPIPCLKKVKIDEDDAGSNEALCCAICLQDFSAASEAATTTCSHVYHPQCIVKWLLKRLTVHCYDLDRLHLDGLDASFFAVYNSAMSMLTFELKVVLIFSTRVVLFLLFFLYILPKPRATRRAL
ncbi:hypothetical protein POTOM_017380 [Populus tomentosa]|uniref:RING-type domain-containing protein n=1 Tax=Populus tomentosa TaxID=118781 RepID=A0A8X7ZYW4_POPTO|nr:hypothetical protein POTOM_017380 [Populus tomentosa]